MTFTEGSVTRPDATTQADRLKLRQETEFSPQTITFSTGAWGKVFLDKASGAEGRASDFNVLRGDQIDFERVRRVLKLAKGESDYGQGKPDFFQHETYSPPAVFVLPINHKTERSFTILEVSSIKESSAARSWGETPKQHRPFFQIRAYIPHDFGSVTSALRHGSAVYSGILRRRPTTKWVFPGFRGKGERESFYQDIKQGFDYQSTQTAYLPLIGQKRGSFETNLLTKPEYLSNHGLLLIAKIISLVKQGRNVDLIAENDKGRSFGRAERILLAQHVSYLLSTDETQLPLSWCTDPISETNTQLVFRGRHEPLPKAQFYGGRDPITLEPAKLRPTYFCRGQTGQFFGRLPNRTLYSDAQTGHER